MSAEIGRAHLAGDKVLRAQLCVEKALYLEFLQSASGTREILAQAQKDAAEVLDQVGDRRGALKFYRKALASRARLAGFLVGKEGTIREQREEIVRLKGILAGNPDQETRVRIEEELRAKGILLPDETLRYDVNVEEVERLIKALEKRQRDTERESEFTRAQRSRLRSDLERIRHRIRDLEVVE